MSLTAIRGRASSMGGGPAPASSTRLYNTRRCRRSGGPTTDGYSGAGRHCTAARCADLPDRSRHGAGAFEPLQPPVERHRTRLAEGSAGQAPEIILQLAGFEWWAEHTEPRPPVLARGQIIKMKCSPPRPNERSDGQSCLMDFADSFVAAALEYRQATCSR